MRCEALDGIWVHCGDWTGGADKIEPLIYYFPQNYIICTIIFLLPIVNRINVTTVICRALIEILIELN